MFLANMSIAAQQVAILCVLVAVGVICDKLGVFTEKIAKGCTDLLFYIVTPAKIIESFFTLEYSPETAKNLFVALGCGFALHAISAFISTFVFNKTPYEKACIYKYSCAYGNCGYMGLPLASAVFDDEGVFFCSAVIISFQTFCFTHGIYLMTKDKEGSQAKLNFKKILFNPGVISVILGMPIFLFSLNLPRVISEPISYTASLNTPLAMFIFGTYIANTSFKSLFKEWQIGVVALIKLIILPLIILGGFKLLGIGGALAGAVTICACAPCANNTAIFAAKYDRDTGLASKTVAVVSMISIATMPVMIALSQYTW